jgi:hypothetical protein
MNLGWRSETLRFQDVNETRADIGELAKLTNGGTCLRLLVIGIQQTMNPVSLGSSTKSCVKILRRGTTLLIQTIAHDSMSVEDLKTLTEAA